LENLVEDLKELNDSWGTRLKGYDYLGEFALPFDEYKYYFSLYRTNGIIENGSSSLPKFIYENLLVILSINCAYFEYDERGFWVHFLKRLGLEDRPTSIQKKIGDQIENYLLSKGFIEKTKEGPLKYVGPILEQTGITRKHLPNFVDFLRSGVENYGWQGLITIPYFIYEGLLPRYGVSIYLLGFLKDSTGFEFFKSVARSIDQSKKEPDQLKFLKKLKGYHPSFWEELFKYLKKEELTKVIKKKKDKIPLPQFVYQPHRNNRIAIIFDPDHIKFNRFKLFDNTVTRPSLEVFEENEFKETYEIHIQDGSYNWYKTKLKGWLPGKNPFAFFDPDSGELLNEQQNLSLDELYLVVSVDFLEKLSLEEKACFEKLIIREYGWLTTPLGLKGFLIKIDLTSNLKFLGIQSKRIDKKLMVWDNPNTLDGAVDFCDVFVESIPEIIIFQPELFIKNHLRLYINTGKGKRPIEILKDNNRVKLPFDVPVKGEVIAEPLGRQRFFDKSRNKVLKFCCIPSCQIKWPDYLLSHDEQPIVETNASNELSFSLPGERQSLEGQRIKWTFSKNQDVIEGSISVENFQIPIAKCLYRPALLNDKMTLIESISRKDFIEGDRFFLKGYPETRAQIFIKSANRTRLLADLGKFDKAGKIIFTGDAVKDALRNFNSPVGRIGVDFKGRMILSGTIIHDTNEIKRCVSELDQMSMDWVNEFPPNTKRALLTVLGAIEGNLKSASIDVCDNLPGGIENWGKEILFFSSVFEKTKLEYSTPVFDKTWEKIKDTICLLEQFVQLKDTTKQLKHSHDYYLQEIEKISWRPPIKKWETKLDQLIANVKAVSNIFDLVLEWKNEVLTSPNVMLQYKSKIAKIDHGKQLTDAWKKYRKRRFQQSFKQCRRVYQNGTPPVSDLAKILENLILYKSGRSELIKKDHKPCHHQLLPIVKKSILLRDKENEKSITEDYSTYLPLLDEDYELL